MERKGGLSLHLSPLLYSGEGLGEGSFPSGVQEAESLDGDNVGVPGYAILFRLPPWKAVRVNGLYPRPFRGYACT